MINNRVYSVYDSKADSYSQPLFYPNDVFAQRAFSDAINDSQVAMSRHPEDYTLFCVGEWNGVDGKLSGAVPMSVCNGLQCVKVDK